MHLDIIATMAIYTVATLAFYLLRRRHLHGMGLVPAAKDMMPVLSHMYTQTLGAVGAMAVLHRRYRHA
jgi:hypothetical protein